MKSPYTQRPDDQAREATEEFIAQHARTRAAAEKARAAKEKPEVRGAQDHELAAGVPLALDRWASEITDSHGREAPLAPGALPGKRGSSGGSPEAQSWRSTAASISPIRVTAAAATGAAARAASTGSAPPPRVATVNAAANVFPRESGRPRRRPRRSALRAAAGLDPDASAPSVRATTWPGAAVRPSASSSCADSMRTAALAAIPRSCSARRGARACGRTLGSRADPAPRRRGRAPRGPPPTPWRPWTR